jgi:hypothetical protein
MIIQLKNMNTSLRKYPVEGKVTESPDFPLTRISHIDRRVTSIDVVVRSRCR